MIKKNVQNHRYAFEFINKNIKRSSVLSRTLFSKEGMKCKNSCRSRVEKLCLSFHFSESLSLKHSTIVANW